MSIAEMCGADRWRRSGGNADTDESDMNGEFPRGKGNSRPLPSSPPHGAYRFTHRILLSTSLDLIRADMLQSSMRAADNPHKKGRETSDGAHPSLKFLSE